MRVHIYVKLISSQSQREREILTNYSWSVRLSSRPFQNFLWQFNVQCLMFNGNMEKVKSLTVWLGGRGSVKKILK